MNAADDPFAEYQRAMKDFHNRLARSMPKRLAIPTVELPKGITELTEALARISAQMAEFQRSLVTTFEPISELLGEVAKNRRKAELVQEAGWLPHSTTPFSMISADETDASAVGDLVFAFYRDEWEGVEAALIDSVRRHAEDAETVATFQEALAAHRYGLHRAVPRLLFPEIERLARVCLYKGKKTKIADLPEFAEAVAGLPAGDVYEFTGGIELFEKMRTHLYYNIGDSDARLAKVQDDPVPNRHAAIHGLVVYATPQSSINALILADFLFYLIRTLGRRLQEADQGQEAKSARHDTSR